MIASRAPPGLRRREGHAGECFARPIRIGGESHHLSTGFDHAEQGQNRDEHGDDESRRIAAEHTRA